jgi:hypothetical protein
MRCPECGLEITPTVRRRLAPSRAMFRSAELGAVVAALLGAAAVVPGAARAWGEREWDRVALIATLSTAALVNVVIWMLGREAMASRPRHVQGRAATIAWLLAAAIVWTMLR